MHSSCRPVIHDRRDMLWACLHFSDLPLRAVFDESDLSQSSAAQPCALVDGPRQRQHIVMVNAQAMRSGARLQQPLAAARALCPALQARARGRCAEKRLLQSLAAWAYRFSSHVSLSEPDALLIEVGASLRLFGGWPALERRLRGELARLDHAPSIAVAPVPAAAHALAARHDGFFTAQREPMLTALGCMTLAHSGLDEKTISLLYNVGMRRLRDVFVLPRPELARRIGPAALAALDRMQGIEHEVLPLYQPPDRFEHRIELDDRVEAWPPLLFPLRRLCNELALFLAARDGGVQRCELVLDHESHAATHVVVELLTPQREARTLYELVRSRLERVALEQPVCGIALLAKDLPTLRPQHQDLFESRRAQALDWPELTERLRAHLGDNAVRRLTSTAEHRPERAWGFDIEASPIAELRPRPLWLLPRALPLRSLPQHILAGPERIESGWWDGADARRDYYVVQTREGQRAWAFLAPGARDGWMLHGWFA
ncbi:MAG: DNA polymerase Y family protein [Rudaea sp.]|nr:DNA polymerase Y family protein [Rudaea sp.]